MARNVRRSVLFQCLQPNNPVYGNKFGWERVNFFNIDNKDTKQLSWGRELPWYEY